MQRQAPGNEPRLLSEEGNSTESGGGEESSDWMALEAWLQLRYSAITGRDQVILEHCKNRAVDANQDNNEVIAVSNGYCLKQWDIRSLILPECWVTEAAIDFYFAMLQDHAIMRRKPYMYFNTKIAYYFYGPSPKDSQEGPEASPNISTLGHNFDNSSDLLRNVDASRLEKIFIPIYNETRPLSALLVIMLASGKAYYDLFGFASCSGEEKRFQLVKDSIQHLLHKMLGGIESSEGNVHLSLSGPLRTQENVDGGTLLLFFADLLANDFGLELIIRNGNCDVVDLSQVRDRVILSMATLNLKYPATT